MENKQIYFNDPQLECYYIASAVTILVAGRRFGKTHGVVAPWMLRNIQNMPRSCMGVVTPSYKMALTQTLPGTFSALEDLGFKKDIHYVVGIKPPKHFQKPLREPARYDRVISWYNGSIQVLISQDIPGTSNSFTLQSVFGDEAKYLNFDKLKEETFPANGGFKGPWANCEWLNSMLFVSDMPTTKKGSWFLSYQEKSNPEVIEAIKICLHQLYKLSLIKENPNTNYKIELIRRDLKQLRSIAIYYKEISSIENIFLLGEKYIREMKRDLPPLVFQTSIMCIKPTKLKDGFYPSLSEKFHYYTAYDNAYLELLGYNNNDKANDCRSDGDLDKSQPICISFDYNSNINWLVCAQIRGQKLLILKSFYVKYNRKLRELVDDFCEYYNYQQNKEVIFYYDHTAIGSNYALNDDDFVSAIVGQFYKNGWSVVQKYIGQAIKPAEKHLIIDQSLKGQKYLYPQFNEPNNEALILAMQMAGCRIGTRGFAKDKTGEKLVESEEDKLEHRTDGTDAFDSLIIGVNFHPYNEYLSGFESVIF